MPYQPSYCCPQFYGVATYGPQAVYPPQAYYTQQYPQQQTSPGGQSANQLVASNADPKRIDRNVSYHQVPDRLGRLQGSTTSIADLEDKIAKLQDCSGQYCREINELKCRVSRLDHGVFMVP
jgi:hypothetical protein